jgi:hypothetical protein
MRYQVDLHYEKDYLRGTVSGQQTLRDNEKLVSMLVSTCIERSLSKLVVDLTGLVGQPGTFSDYQLANFSVEQVLPFIKKVALITTQDNMKFTTFFETVSRNRGLNVIAFVDEEEALTWISED